MKPYPEYANLEQADCLVACRIGPIRTPIASSAFSNLPHLMVGLYYMAGSVH